MADPQDQPNSEPDGASTPPEKKPPAKAVKKAAKAPGKKAPAKKAPAKKAVAKKAPAKKAKLDGNAMKLLEEDLRSRPAATFQKRAALLHELARG